MFLRDVRRGTAARCIRSIASSGRLPPTDRTESACGRRGASAIAHHALICTVPWTQGLTTACGQFRSLGGEAPFWRHVHQTRGGSSSVTPDDSSVGNRALYPYLASSAGELHFRFFGVS